MPGKKSNIHKKSQVELEKRSTQTIDDAAQVQLTEAEQVYASLQSRKLAFFIGTLSVPDAIKQDLFEIAEGMDLKTLERFIGWMEANYVAQNLKFLDVAFEKEARVIAQKYDKKREKLTNKAVADVRGLTEKVKHRGLTARLESVKQ